MTVRITLAGATGWIGKELTRAIAKYDDMTIVAAVSRSGAGKDVGEVAGLQPCGVRISGTLAGALKVPSDVMIDYTKPNAVKGHVLEALAQGRHVVIGTSGLSDQDYAEIDSAARSNSCGVLAAGNFSITATLMRRFALEAARYVPDVEIIDYAGPGKTDTPSGTARELAELLGPIRRPSTAKPVAELSGVRETRGGGLGRPNAIQIHSLRMPSFVLSCEVVLGADNERLVIRHDAGASAAPYVAGTLLAARSVSSFAGLKRGLDAVM
jgi:4-hydroxy-tetrahydrodipicolinate reductase